MSCPNCGKQTSPDQKFCRFCGSSLAAIAEVPPERAAVAEAENPSAKVTKRMAARRMRRALFWGLIIIGIGITLLSNAQEHDLLNWLGISIFLAGIGLAIYGAFSPEKASALPSSQSSQAKALNQSGADSYLPPGDFSEPVPSVTERTTELLEIEKTKPSR